MSCDEVTREAIELLAYGEAAPGERDTLERHLAACDRCRAEVEQLRTIRRAMSDRGVVDAPAGGDWTPFMSRLEARLDRLDRLRATTRQERTPRDRRFPSFRAPSEIRVASWSALAAMLLLGIALGTWWAHERRAPAPQAATAPAPGVVPQEVAVAAVTAAHLERSKLVLLGLSNKDAADTRVDWSYERKMAGELLPDTSLYRLAAQRQRLPGLARVLRDLELVLLQASLSEDADAPTLARLQRVIRSRDLVTRVDTLSGIVDRPARAVAASGI